MREKNNYNKVIINVSKEIFFQNLREKKIIYHINNLTCKTVRERI